MADDLRVKPEKGKAVGILAVAIAIICSPTWIDEQFLRNAPRWFGLHNVLKAFGGLSNLFESHEQLQNAFVPGCDWIIGCIVSGQHVALTELIDHINCSLSFSTQDCVGGISCTSKAKQRTFFNTHTDAA